MACNRANFLRRLALSAEIEHWSLTTLCEKLLKIGAKVTRHAKYVTFQLAQVTVQRRLFAAILDPITQSAIPPPCVRGAALRQQPLGFPDDGHTNLHSDCQRASDEKMVENHHALGT